MFIIYKTTNKINGKFYIGVHNGTRNWYKGSGSILKKAIRKYGVSNFLRETLYELDNEVEAYLKEQEIVTVNLLSDPLCYNLRLGGRGGRSGVVTVKDKDTSSIIGSVSILHPNYVSGKWVHILKGRDTFAKARIKALEVRKNQPGPRTGQTLSNETKEKIRKSRTGIKQSIKTIEKRSAALKGIIPPTYTCPHCDKIGKGNSMKQWHFNRCKFILNQFS
jgi:group I intron endonuclease